jgi:hypothetical protein
MGKKYPECHSSSGIIKRKGARGSGRMEGRGQKTKDRRRRTEDGRGYLRYLGIVFTV